MPQRRFAGYPTPRKALDLPYKQIRATEPTLKGYLLVIAIWLLSHLQLVSKFIWWNANFGVLRKLKQLHDYPVRHDVPVIPLRNPEDPVPDPRSITDPKSFNAAVRQDAASYYTSVDFHAMYTSGQLTPLAVVEALLPVIRRDVEPRHEHSIAFVHTSVNLVLEAAKRSTERYKKGNALGVLDGVPIAVKSEIAVAGYLTSWGSKKEERYMRVETESSWVIAKLQEAGAIVIGKSLMGEHGINVGGINPWWGSPRNLFNSEYCVGGSSTGAGYAVGAGLVPISIGFDKGGSVRGPAKLNGAYGLIMTFGRAAANHVSNCTFGFVAASIADLEVTTRISAIPDPSDFVASSFRIPRPLTRDRRRVIGIYDAWFQDSDPEVLKLCTDAVNYLRETLGYEIRSINIPYPAESMRALSYTAIADQYAFSKTRADLQGYRLFDEISSPTKLLYSVVSSHTMAHDYLLAGKLRSLLMSHLAYLWQETPDLLILTPSEPAAGYERPRDEDLKFGVASPKQMIKSMQYYILGNLVGAPCITCPIGYSKPGKGNGDLPVGLMAMGEWGAEDLLIEWGRELEKYLNEVYPGGRHRPEKWQDVLGSTSKS